MDKYIDIEDGMCSEILICLSSCKDLSGDAQNF